MIRQVKAALTATMLAATMMTIACAPSCPKEEIRRDIGGVLTLVKDEMRLMQSTSAMMAPTRLAAVQTKRREIEAKTWPVCAQEAGKRTVVALKDVEDVYDGIGRQISNEALRGLYVAVLDREAELAKLVETFGN